MAETRTENASKGEDVTIPCVKCTARTHHVVLQSVEIEARSEWTDWDDAYRIVKCQGCKSLSFMRVYSDSESYMQVGPDDWEPNFEIDIYPSRVEGRKELDGLRYLPQKISSIYRETSRAQREGLRILVGVGIRAIVETVCKELDAKGRDLQTKIDDLASKGLVSKGNATVLHHLRVLGNKAAHEVEPHTDRQLMLAMLAVDNLLQGAYIIPKRAAQEFGESAQ